MILGCDFDPSNVEIVKSNKKETFGIVYFESEEETRKFKEFVEKKKLGEKGFEIRVHES